LFSSRLNIAALLLLFVPIVSAGGQSNQQSSEAPAAAQAGQTQPTASASAEPVEDIGALSAKAHAILDNGVKVTGLTAPDGKPWHMKATYQVGNGIVTDAGTIEEWWKGPDQWRRTYTNKAGSGTEWSVKRASRFQSRDAWNYTLLDLRVAGPLVAPMTQTVNFKPDYPMDLKQVSAGIPLNCVSVIDPAQYSDKVDPDFLFPNLCFDAGSRLRFMGTSDTTVTFNKYQMFQGRAVAGKVEVIVLGEKKSSMEITLLEPLSAQDEALVAPDSKAVEQPYALTAVDPPPVPVYQVGAVITIAAMHDRQFGTVFVPVIIRKDGRVKLNGGAPGGGMGQAAADAIVQWRYQPYLVDGQLVDVSTMVPYVFDGRPFVPLAENKPKPASTSGYDPKRDPKADLAQAMADAQKAHKRILVEVGGDWCIWCAYMDKFFADHPDLVALRDANYVSLKVNMSQENHNYGFLSQYPRFHTYPHLLVLDADGKLLQSEDTDSLEKGQSYDEARFRDFLTQWKPS
jgi:hypothetical protein